jgi:RNA polymerase sigma-70 factor, ECF subfamily
MPSRMAVQTATGGRSPGAWVYCPKADGLPGVVTEHALDYAEQTDEALVELLAERDVQALETLYGRHARAVYSLSLKLLGEPGAAEEIVQECFLKLWRRPELYRASRGRLLTWLLGVTHHRAIDRLRRRTLELRHAGDERLEPAANGEYDPEQQAWSRIQLETIGRALAHLPRNQRQTLELAYLRGMTQVEIAACLDQPLGTIKTRMRLALQKLRAMPELEALVADAG